MLIGSEVLLSFIENRIPSLCFANKSEKLMPEILTLLPLYDIVPMYPLRCSSFGIWKPSDRSNAGVFFSFTYNASLLLKKAFTSLSLTYALVSFCISSTTMPFSTGRKSNTARTVFPSFVLTLPNITRRVFCFALFALRLARTRYGLSTILGICLIICPSQNCVHSPWILR